MTKIFVGYFEYNPYEGCSEPQSIFFNELEAAKWCIGTDIRRYVELEVEDDKQRID